VTPDAGPSRLEGAALVAELARRFAPVTAAVEVAGRPVELLRPPSADALISEEDFARDERLPYWADLWPSACVLADALAAEAGAGRTLLEVGSGLGLAAIAAMQAGYRVTASDYYADALAFTRANAWRALGREPEARLLDLRALPDDLPRYDRVVAADVLYERPYAPLLAAALTRGLAPGGLATVADPGRLAARAFLDEARALGLLLVSETTHPWTDGKHHSKITLYSFSLPR
jgi:predicted nicotinamide N-methyase